MQKYPLLMNRRNFIGKIGMAATVGSAINLDQCIPVKNAGFYIATWNNEYAVEKAFQVYKDNSNILDGLVGGINEVENNPADQSVGLGGRPDRNGNVTLDACIMDQEGNAGSVCYVQNIQNPISLARDVMEKTPHVILAGKGALDFAQELGYQQKSLLTPESKRSYKEWLKESKYKPIINIENHDTIGMLGISDEKEIVGGCSTSGLAFKMAGRVGDSPIIGAGLYNDPEIGACVATGLGEKVLTSLSAFLAVELMRQGKSPAEACKEAVQRIIKKEKKKPDFQVALIALNKKGEHGAFAIYNHFNYVLKNAKETKKMAAPFVYEYE